METQEKATSGRESLGHEDRLGLELQEITNAMVRIHKELFGHGPPKARSAYAGPDTLITTFENSLTAAERNILALGEHQRVRETRTLLQYANERDFVQTIEQITGRRVRAFVSGTDAHKDVSAEVFFLEPVAKPRSDQGG